MAAKLRAVVDNTLHKFFKVTEVDEANHIVYGLATEEEIDASNEICDYADAKPAYQEWSARMAASTKAAGQEVSLGNIRLQHTTEIAGKITKIDYDDSAKQIKIGTEPLNDTIWEMVRRGFVTGFSQGGKYTYRKCNECGADCGEAGKFKCPDCKKRVVVRYGIVPAEVSYVDNPCLTTAHFMYIKADGAKELRKFQPNQLAAAIAAQPVVKASSKTKRVAGEDLHSSAFAWVGDPDDPSTWKLPIKFSSKTKTESHIRNALSRFGQTQGIPDDKRDEVKAKILSAARRHGIHAVGINKAAGPEGGNVTDLKRGLLEAVTKLRSGDGAQKGMYHIGFLANLISDLKYLETSARSEGEYEEDERDIVIADDILDVLGELVGILQRIVADETSELLAAGKAANYQGENVMTINDALKAARAGLAAHFRKAAANHEASCEMHKCISDEHLAAVETHKSAMDDDGANKSYHKAMVGHHNQLHKSHMKLSKAHGAMQEHCNKMADDQDKEIEKVEIPEVTKVVAPAEPAKPAEKAAAPGPDGKTVTPPAEPAKPAEPAANPNLPVDLTTEVSKSVQTMVGAAINDAVKEALGGIGNNESIKKMVTDAVTANVQAVLGGITAPTGTKVAGPELVARNGQQVSKGAQVIDGASDNIGL